MIHAPPISPPARAERSPCFSRRPRLLPPPPPPVSAYNCVSVYGDIDVSVHLSCSVRRESICCDRWEPEGGRDVQSARLRRYQRATSEGLLGLRVFRRAVGVRFCVALGAIAPLFGSMLSLALWFGVVGVSGFDLRTDDGFMYLFSFLSWLRAFVSYLLRRTPRWFSVSFSFIDGWWLPWFWWKLRKNDLTNMGPAMVRSPAWMRVNVRHHISFLKWFFFFKWRHWSGKNWCSRDSLDVWLYG